MKPAAFEYDAPDRLEDALELLAEPDEEVKVLAGGQSLVPLLNLRLARPDRLVDINRIERLAYVRSCIQGLCIGALARHTELEHSEVAAAQAPLLVEAVRYVGHAQIRNRGTVGGSVAHADPAGELPVALTALGARYHVRSRRGSRSIEGANFHVGPLTTALAPDELLVEIEVPAQPAAAGSAFLEYARRDGDFALAGAAVLLELEQDGRSCCACRIALLGAGPTPVLAEDAASSLLGQPVDADSAADAGDIAARTASPIDDIHGSAEYRRGLIGEIVKRAILIAAARTAGAV
jgi:CO/xanthine dehydrogenase FAD-binding subunit